MKKYFIIASILLLASGCVKQAVAPTQPPTGSTSTSTPPSTTAGWNSYISPNKYGFSIKYPNEFGFNTDISLVPAGNVIACRNTNGGSGTMLACAYYIGNSFTGTNFQAAAVSVNIIPALTTQSSCYNFSSAYNQAQKSGPDITINGIVFKTASGGTGAAGTSNSMEVYRNFHNNQCFELDQSIFENDVSNSPQFNQNQAMQKLQGVVNTFEFTDSTPSINKTYINNTYGFQFSYPFQTELSLDISDNQGNRSYGIDVAGQPSDPEIDSLNKGITATTSAILMVNIEDIAFDYPKSIDDACKQQGRPLTDGIKCLNAGSDAGPGATQDFIYAERNALQNSQPGSDFNYFDYSPTVSVPNAFAFHKITGKVFQNGTTKVYAYAVPDYQSPQLDYSILAFDTKGNIIQIFYYASDSFGASTDYSKLTASDVANQPNWKTVENIASSFKFTQ